MHGYAYEGKRLLDVTILIVSAPITLPVIALTSLAVLALDGRPVFFKQERAGLEGKPFNLFKFRTMVQTSPAGLNGLSLSEQTTQSDAARITPFGRLLRKTSLDELPQLLNVARREMSLVGPRPLFIRYEQYYTTRERLRLSVLPGVTGHSQVAHRNNGGWRNRLELDAAYVDNASLLFDSRILADTLLKSLRSQNLSVVAGQTGDALDDERKFPEESGIYMRRVYERDLETRVKWLSSPEVRNHMTLGDTINIETTRSWHNSIRRDPLRRDYTFETIDGTLVAMSGVKAVPEKSRAEFYVFVNPDFQGRRIGSIATSLTLAECKTENIFNTIWLTVRRENVRAITIYKRMGFSICEVSDERFGMQLHLEP